MVDWVPIVAATVSALPAAGAFFVTYGRYDGAFRDNVVFLYFIGGLVLGGFLGFLTLLLYSTTATLIQLVGVALLYPIAIVALCNRRKWQGDRHAIFNSGAVGLGVAVMLGFSFTFFSLDAPRDDAQDAADAQIAAKNLSDSFGRNVTQAPAVDSTGYAFHPVLAPQGALLAVGLAGLMFGLGLLVGDGVRRKKQIVVALTGAATLIAPSIFLLGYFKDRTWLWLVLLAAYGAIYAYAAERKLMERAIPEGWKRERRRRVRAERE